MTYPSLVSGPLFASRSGLSNYPWLVADAPKSRYHIENITEEDSFLLAEAFSMFQRETYKLVDTDIEFTQTDEDRIMFMIKCLIDIRKDFNAKKEIE